MAEEGVGDPARGLDPQHKHRVGVGQVMHHLTEGVRLRQLIHLRNGVHLQRQGMLKAVGEGTLLLPGVQPLVHAPGLIRIAQALFDIFQVAIPQLAQEASDGDPAGPARQTDAFRGFKRDLRGVRQQPAPDPLFAGSELAERRFDTAQHLGFRRHTASLLTGCQKLDLCYRVNNARRVPCSR
jgi:hypothetical protein